MLPFKLGRIMARVGAAAVTLSASRRRAVGAFRAGLREAGVPDAVAAELARSFPRFRLPDLGGHPLPVPNDAPTGVRRRAP
jgi:hypothetical protein